MRDGILAYWPVALAVAPALIAWGDLRRSVNGLRRDVDGKVGKDEFGQVDKRLERIEGQLDRLLERN